MNNISPPSQINNPPQPQNLSQPPLKPKTSFGYLVIVALAALVIGGGIWGYLQWKVNPELEKTPETINAQSRESGEEETGAEEDSDWQTFSDSEISFTFEYLAGWEIKEKYFYETAAGEKATNPTIVLCPIEINDYNNNSLRCTSCITFNMRQEACADFNAQFTMENIGTNSVCCSGGNNPTRDEIIAKIKETFKVNQ